MARTCKWGVVKVVGGDIWNHSGDAMITPANNRLSGREGEGIYTLRLISMEFEKYNYSINASSKGINCV